MLAIAPPGLATAVRISSRYGFSSERKWALHGSIFLMLNLALTCAAKSFKSIFPRAVPTDAPVSLRPKMRSRNGYDAIAIRSRAAAGKRRLGPASAANAVAILADGPRHTPAPNTTP